MTNLTARYFILMKITIQVSTDILRVQETVLASSDPKDLLNLVHKGDEGSKIKFCVLRVPGRELNQVFM